MPSKHSPIVPCIECVSEPAADALASTLMDFIHDNKLSEEVTYDEVSMLRRLRCAVEAQLQQDGLTLCPSHAMESVVDKIYDRERERRAGV